MNVYDQRCYSLICSYGKSRHWCWWYMVHGTCMVIIISKQILEQVIENIQALKIIGVAQRGRSLMCLVAVVSELLIFGSSSTLWEANLQGFWQKKADQICSLVMKTSSDVTHLKDNCVTIIVRNYNSHLIRKTAFKE